MSIAEAMIFYIIRSYDNNRGILISNQMIALLFMSFSGIEIKNNAIPLIFADFSGIGL